MAFLGLSNILNSLIMLSLGILLPNISEDLGLSSAQQGFLGSSMFIGTMIMSLPAGLWLSRPDASKVLLGALAFGTAFVMVQAWAPNYTVLLLARLAFGHCNRGPAAGACLTDRPVVPETGDRAGERSG